MNYRTLLKQVVFLLGANNSQHWQAFLEAAAAGSQNFPEVSVTVLSAYRCLFQIDFSNITMFYCMCMYLLLLSCFVAALPSMWCLFGGAPSISLIRVPRGAMNIKTILFCSIIAQTHFVLLTTCGHPTSICPPGNTPSGGAGKQTGGRWKHVWTHQLHSGSQSFQYPVSLFCLFLLRETQKHKHRALARMGRVGVGGFACTSTVTTATQSARSGDGQTDGPTGGWIHQLLLELLSPAGLQQLLASAPALPLSLSLSLSSARK